jgi:hypothetical protein
MKLACRYTLNKPCDADSYNLITIMLAASKCMILQDVSLQERQEEKNRKMERLQQQLAVAQKQLAVARKEKVEVEAHADVLERALMKMSMEKAQVQVG